MTISTFTRSAAAALVAVSVAAGSAAAAPGYISQPINLRAGPGVDYPWIASLPQGTPAEVFGCLDGWSWCDVAVTGATGGLRGWVAGPGVEIAYQNREVPLEGYGQEIGVPFIGFDFNTYWGRYYRGRSWYSPVDRWRGGGGPGFDHGRGFDGGRGGGGPGDRGPGDRGPGDRGPGGGGPGGGGPDFNRGGHGGGEPGRPQGGQAAGFQGRPEGRPAEGPAGGQRGPQPAQGERPQQFRPGAGPERGPGGPGGGPERGPGGPGAGPGGGHGPAGPGPEAHGPPDRGQGRPDQPPR